MNVYIPIKFEPQRNYSQLNFVNMIFRYGLPETIENCTLYFCPKDDKNFEDDLFLDSENLFEVSAVDFLEDIRDLEKRIQKEDSYIDEYKRIQNIVFQIYFSNIFEK